MYARRDYLLSMQCLSKQGDIIELVLDINAGKLSLHLPTEQQFHMQLPKYQTWRLHVIMYHAGDRIRICQ